MRELRKLNASIAIFNQKLNNIHFNYKGKEFYSIHKLSEKLYKECLELYDDLSEKISMNNGIVEASFTEYLDISVIDDVIGKKWNFEEVIETVDNDILSLIKQTNKVNVTNTIQPLLDEVYMILDKYRWLFNSFKQ